MVEFVVSLVGFSLFFFQVRMLVVALRRINATEEVNLDFLDEYRGC